MWSIVGVIVIVASLTHVDAELDAGGPHNVVGYFRERVTLHCNRNASGAVTWRYIRPGTNHEQPVPGMHWYSGSSYGLHNIRLENLQRSDAGLYVCRSTNVPQSFDPASAFVVVVADHPTCRANYTKQGKHTVSCRIAYTGLLNLTLSMLRSDDNSTIASRNYTSVVEGSWWHLDSEVNSSSYPRMKGYACRAKFYSSKTVNDIAKNRPTYIEVPCEPPPPPGDSETRGSSSVRARSQTAMTVTPGVFNQTAVDGMKNTAPKTTIGSDRSSSQAALSMSVIALIIVLALAIAVILFLIHRRKSKRQKRQRSSDGGGQPDVEDDAENATPMLLEADSTLPLNSSAVKCKVSDSFAQSHRDTTTAESCPFPENRRLADVQPSNSVSTSTVSNVSLHSHNSDSVDEDDEDEDSNEHTVVPSAAGRKLAADAAAAVRLGSTSRNFDSTVSTEDSSHDHSV